MWESGAACKLHDSDARGALKRGAFQSSRALVRFWFG
jgi:hypothetical protein